MFQLARRSRQPKRTLFAFTCLAIIAIVAPGAATAQSLDSTQTSLEPASFPLKAQEQGILLSALEKAPDHGLGGADLSALRLALADPGEDARAVAGDVLITMFQTYASAMRGARLVPSEVDRNWGLQPDPFDFAAEFDAARARGDLTDWIAALAPSHEGYARLVTLSRRYQTIVSGGGWTPIGGGALHEGDKGSSVSDLRNRLRLEGYNALALAETDTFDAPLTAALTAFQAAHVLEQDGVLGEATRRALNVTAEDRLAQISVNQERWRWLPRSMPPTRIEVDTAGAELTLIVNNEPDLTMRIIVGRTRLPTPSFQTQVDEVVFNPTWNVPASIAREEILPAAARDPTYLQRHGYTLTNGRVVQAAGPGNALGLVKFGSPNPYGVYLHDTPNRSLFARSDRRLSHGCMRVEAPLELAAALLAAQAWTHTSTREAINSGRTQRIALARPAPFFVVYRTVLASADGFALFVPDGYGWDAELEHALARAEASPSRAQVVIANLNPSARMQ